MKAVGSFETSVTSLLITTERHFPEDRIPHTRGCENVKPHICAIHVALSDILTLADVGDCYVREGPAKVGIEHTDVLVYIYIYIYIYI